MFCPGVEEAPDYVLETQPSGTSTIVFADHQCEKVEQSSCMYLLHRSRLRIYVCVFASSHSPVQLDCPTQQHVRKCFWRREGCKTHKQVPRLSRSTTTTRVEVMNHEI